jgi:serine/threonine-protein kinase HipA
MNGKRKNITRKDLMAVGKSMNIKNTEEIMDKVAIAVSNWNDYAILVNIEDKLRDTIKATHIIL